MVADGNYTCFRQFVPEKVIMSTSCARGGQTSHFDEAKILLSSALIVGEQITMHVFFGVKKCLRHLSFPSTAIESWVGMHLVPIPC